MLVTGGAGFVGSHVVEHLLDGGEEVAVVDDLSTGKRENVSPGVRLYEADVRSGQELAEVFGRFRPEVLCHQAAQTDVRLSVREPDFDAGVNVLGTIHLLQNCIEHGVGRVVFASTGGDLRRAGGLPRDRGPSPISSLTLRRLEARRGALPASYAAQHGISYVALRYANVYYGPRQDPHGEAGVAPLFAANPAADRASTINGTGEQTRDYVYVEDVARANVLALGSVVPDGAYNIGTGVETSVNELYERMRRVSGRDLPPKHGPAKPGEQLRSCVNSLKAARFLGWRPRIDLDAGLERTLHSFSAAG